MIRPFYVFVGYVVDGEEKVDSRFENYPFILKSWQSVAKFIIYNNSEITKDNIIYIKEYTF